MKIYEEKKDQNNKSWSIKLNQDSGETISLDAVDSITEEKICKIIVFYKGGVVTVCTRTFDDLEYAGYDPGEHRNTFKHDGSIILSLGMQG